MRRGHAVVTAQGAVAAIGLPSPDPATEWRIQRPAPPSVPAGFVLLIEEKLVTREPDGDVSFLCGRASARSGVRHERPCGRRPFWRLVADHDGHTYYLCRAGLSSDAFVEDPARFIASHMHAAEQAPAGTPEIDDGMRRWYESCSCCLSDAYPDVSRRSTRNARFRNEPGTRRDLLSA